MSEQMSACSFTHVAHNMSLSVSNVFSFREIIHLISARGGPCVEHAGDIM